MSPRAKKLKRVVVARRKMRDMAAGALAGAEQEVTTAKALKAEMRATLDALMESSVDSMRKGVGVEALWQLEASRTWVNASIDAKQKDIEVKEARAESLRADLRARAGEARRSEKILDSQKAEDAQRIARNEQKASDDRGRGPQEPE